MADFDVRLGRGGGVWVALGLCGVLVGCQEPSVPIVAEPLAARAVPSPVAAPVLVTLRDRPQPPNMEPMQIPLESIVRPKHPKRSKARVAPSVQAHRRDVFIGGAVLSGGSVSNAARVVAGLRAGFKNCYQRPEFGGAGSVRFLVSIGEKGEVTSVEPSASGALSNLVLSCATELVQAARFEAPATGSAKLRFPVSFVGGHGKPQAAPQQEKPPTPATPEPAESSPTEQKRVRTTL